MGFEGFSSSYARTGSQSQIISDIVTISYNICIVTQQYYSYSYSSYVKGAFRVYS